MKTNLIIKSALTTFLVLTLAQISISAELKQGDKIKIVTPETVARLCPYASCGSNEHITRIPQGTILEIEGINTVKSGMMSVKWFEVKYKKDRGWVSIYDTDKQ